MASRHKASIRIVADSGGHYGAMIREGVPKAIEWFKSLEKTASQSPIGR